MPPSRKSLANVLWILMLCTIIVVGLPLGYVVSHVKCSGAAMSPVWHDRFVVLNTFTECDASSPATTGCSVCFDPNLQGSSTLCWNPLLGQGRYLLQPSCYVKFRVAVVEISSDI